METHCCSKAVIELLSIHQACYHCTQVYSLIVPDLPLTTQHMRYSGYFNAIEVSKSYLSVAEA